MFLSPNRPRQDCFDVLIAGGSYIGSLLALLLDRQGFHVGIVDKHIDEPVRPDGRAFAVNDTSLTIFDSINLANVLHEQGHPVRAIEVVEAHLLRGIAANPLCYDAHSLVGHPFGIVIESHRVLTALRNALAVSNVTRIQATIIDHDPGDADTPARLVNDDGSEHQAWVLAACDGRNSLLRTQADILCRDKAYPSSAIVCTIAIEKPHEGCAVEYFFPTGPFAMVPLPDQRCNIIWCEDRALAATLMRMDIPTFEKHLSWRACNRFGAISLCQDAPRISYPLGMHNVPNIVSNRLVLLGDAAHAIHPIAGLGVNLGFRDAFVLAHCLDQEKRQGSRPGNHATLRRYQRKRRFDVDKHIAMTDMIQSLFAVDWPFLNLARQWGFRICDRMPLIQRLFIRQASPSIG